MGSMLHFEEGCKNMLGCLQAMVVICDEKYIATYFTFVFYKLIKIESVIHPKYGDDACECACVCVCVCCSSTAGSIEHLV